MAKIDGVVSKLRYAAFRVIPYYIRFRSNTPVTDLTGLDDESLDRLAGEDVPEPDDSDIDSGDADL